MERGRLRSPAARSGSLAPASIEAAGKSAGNPAHAAGLWQHPPRRNERVRLGIDFGTTRTVVACCDRGNYPVISFQDDRGDTTDWFLGRRRARRRAPLRLRRSGDRLGSRVDAPPIVQARPLRPAIVPDFEVEVGSLRLPVLDLLTRFLVALREAILHRSNRPKRKGEDERLVAVVATPANAHGTQRFATLDAFRRAGFEVTAMLNEPPPRASSTPTATARRSTPSANTSSSTTSAAAPSTPRSCTSPGVATTRSPPRAATTSAATTSTPPWSRS